ncbi:hypothetical protein ACO0RG_004665 [Hanseniaspora osmophila]|uniref:DNA-directed RNA polymerase III subunit RPC6 n=1 Tax=Hanseniaspora osmophila TaxID=56408 RepID=A0A1E5RZJ0_9ASCO|nr:DNA-directed RNA polymerase III subunit RPC6 [Hanseniaspora osmophila]
MNFNADMMNELSDPAKGLYDVMISQPRGTIFNQDEITNATGKQSSDNRLLLQELINKNLVKVVKHENSIKFQAVDVSEASKKSTMSRDEQLVYSYIEASGREGIWIKTIKARTNLHQHIVVKCLKNLETQRYVKVVKSVKFPTRKIYMLYNLQPSIEVTGGPWFTDGELDDEFISHLLTVIWRYVGQRTFPDGFNNFNDVDFMTGKGETLYTKSVNNYASSYEILEFINGANISKVDLSPLDIESLCDVLYYDNRLCKVGLNSYKVTLQSVLDLMGEDKIGVKLEDETAMAAGKDSAENGNKVSRNECNTIVETSFNIFQSKNFITPSLNDKEAVFFDEWML